MGISSKNTGRKASRSKLTGTTGHNDKKETVSF